MVGPSGSGKTSWLRHHGLDLRGYLSLDVLRDLAGDHPHDQTASPVAVSVLRLLREERLARGLLTVVDTTASKMEYLIDHLDAADRHGRRIVAVRMMASAEECVATQLFRDGCGLPSVPEDVVREMWETTNSTDYGDLLDWRADCTVFVGRRVASSRAFLRGCSRPLAEGDETELRRITGPSEEVFLALASSLVSRQPLTS